MHLGLDLYWLHLSRFRSTSRVQWKLKPAASNEEEDGGGKPKNDGDGDDGGDGNGRCVDDDAKTGGQCSEVNCHIRCIKSR